MTGFSITCLRCGTAMVLKPGVSDPEKEPIRFGNWSEDYDFMKCKCGNEIRDRFEYVFDDDGDGTQVYKWVDASKRVADESVAYGQDCRSGRCEF